MMQEQRQTGQKAGLSREMVLSAARAIADRDGVNALSMRTLARELGVMPNAIYTYFPTKDAILDALLDSLLEQIDTDGLDAFGWREALITIMDDSRHLLLAHPRLVDVFLTRPNTGPNAARLGEATFHALGKAGLVGEQAVAAFRILLIFSLGYAAFQGPRLGDVERSRRGEAAFRDLPGDRYRQMRDLALPLSRPPDDETFLAGIGWLLDGIERTAAG